VARSLRSGESLLVETGCHSGKIAGSGYRASYLVAALLSDRPVAILPPAGMSVECLVAELESWQQKLGTQRKIFTDVPASDRHGIWPIEPVRWWQMALTRAIPTEKYTAIIDGADDLPAILQEATTTSLTARDWQELEETLAPADRPRLWQYYDRLWQLYDDRPNNRYHRYTIDADASEILAAAANLNPDALPPQWQRFLERSSTDKALNWASLTANDGGNNFHLHTSTLDLATHLTSLWQQNHWIAIGSAIAPNRHPQQFCRSIGMPADTASVIFTPHSAKIPLSCHVPVSLPLPNTPQFLPLLAREILQILVRATLPQANHHPLPTPFFTVILTDDIPLQPRLASILAGNLGSRVRYWQSPQVKDLPTAIATDNILIIDWQSWLYYQDSLPPPTIAIAATLPIPSPEDPLVAKTIEFYKHRHGDWFRDYLLPIGIHILRRAIFTLRTNGGQLIVADRRFDTRNYGKQIRQSLRPIEFPSG
jgi:ATP-dependent DNA helicase DinG